MSGTTKNTKGKGRAPLSLVERLQDLEDQIPLTEEEQARYLPPPEARAEGLKRIMALVEAAEARPAQLELEAGRAGREAAVRKIKAASRVRPRAESLAIIAALRSRLPAHAQVVGFHRNLDEMSDEDLDVLVADLQVLTGKK